MVSDDGNRARRNPTLATPVYEFGRFRLETGKRLLVSSHDERVVPLPARVFDTLVCFVERPGKLLTKSMLLEAVWPDLSVEENSLSRNISILRRALGDDSAAFRYILTEQGRGYRFVADVHEVESARGSGVRTARDAEILELVQQARTLSVRPSEQNLQGALAIVRQAVERDPSCALAHCMLARVCGTFLVFDLPVAGGVFTVEQAARKALELDPALGDAHASLGVVRALQGRWIEAEQHFRSGEARGSQSDTHALYLILVAHSVGHVERALSESLRLHRLMPSDPFFPVCIALAYAALGNDQEVLRYADLARALGQPRDQAPLQDLYAELALRSGQFREAARLTTSGLSPAMRAAGGETSVGLLFAALEDGRNRDAALHSLRALETRTMQDHVRQVDMKRLLVWYTLLGDVESAYAAVSRCVDRFAATGTVGSAWGFLWRPEMLPFRRNPSFKKLVARLGFPDYWLEYGSPDRA
jgi:DNA-binding winged helix-turn-helix (wHTH) protein